MQTSSPFSPRGTGVPCSSNTSTFMPSARHWISPRHTGADRIAADETAHDVGAAGNRREVDVALDVLVDEVEALRRQRRSGGRHRPHAWRAVRRRAGAARPSATASMNLADVPNSVIRGLVREGEQRVAVGMKRRAVVEQDGRARRQHRHQPVPHHPAERREVEDAIARLDVAVELVLLEVLDQRAAGAVDDALGDAGRARGIQDVERMIERQPRRTTAARSAMRPDEGLPAVAPTITVRSTVGSCSSTCGDLRRADRTSCRRRRSASAAISTRGSIWPKRSSTPCTPKSGEHDDHTAPTTRRASTATIASGTLAGRRRRGRRAGCRPPRSAARKRRGLRAQLVATTSSATSRLSDLKMMAASSPSSRRTFSAKFRRASGKNCAPGIRSISIATRCPSCPTTPPKSHIASQNSSGRSLRSSRRARVARALPEPRQVRACQRSAEGIQSGAVIQRVIIGGAL